MDGGVTVISSPTVSVRLTSTLSSHEVIRRFNRGITIAELKSKLELVIGTPASCMDMQLFSVSDKFLQKLEDDEALLGSYPVEDDCRIHVIDCSGAQLGEFTDLSKVEKYVISEDAYEKRADSVRSFMKRQRMGPFSDDGAEQKQAEREAAENAAAAAIAVGQRCQVHVPGQPAKPGTVMYVGATEFKPGLWVGIKYDEPLGKNDGSVNGKRYFECQAKYGAFVRPSSVTAAGLCQEDFGPDEM